MELIRLQYSTNEFFRMVFVSSILVLIEKMFKKFNVCDYFLEIACYCLSIDVDFAQFKRMCIFHFGKRNGSNSIFVILKTSQFMRQSLFHVTYVACCKDIVDLQIDLFNETSSRLRSIGCENTSKQHQDVDFNYEEDTYLSDYDVDSDVFDRGDDDNVELVRGHAFSYSLFYTQMRSFRRFCVCCQEVFLMYFVSKLHIISQDDSSL